MRGIAISGKAGSGKSSLAREIIEVLAPDGHRVAFAGALKLEVLERHGLRKEDPGGRETLISYGEEKRTADPDYWIRPLAETVEALWWSGSVPVIDDLRFRRELEWCREAGLYVVRVDAPTRDRIERLRSLGLDEGVIYSLHPGETELDGADFDFRFLNGGIDSCTLQCTAQRIVRRARASVHV